MLKSMTAYGRHQCRTDAGEFLWELRSVNHRYLELSLRLPEPLRFIEPAVRARLGERLNRGKIDAVLRFTATDTAAPGLTVNHELANRILSEAETIASNSALDNVLPIDPMAILGWQGVVSETKAEESELRGHAMDALDDALEDYIAARSREGKKLVEMLEERCAAIGQIVTALRDHRPGVLEKQQEKLRKRIADLQVEVDQHRLEQELVFHAQKLDVDEELDRLDAHISEMRKIFLREEPVGRRLDFMMQEFNREANTLGSKSHDSETTAQAVELKVLIEQMREQVQNIE